MAQTPEFKYAPMFQMGNDETEYYLLTKDGVSVSQFEGKPVLKVTPEALTMLTQQAFHNVSFMLRRAHNEQVAKILTDPEASDNDKYVALSFLRNAEVASRVPLLYTVKRDNRYGRAFAMKKPSLVAFTTPTHKTTCATHRMHPSICTTR